MSKLNLINYDYYVVMLCQASQELINREDKIRRYAEIMSPLYQLARDGSLGKHTYEIVNVEQVLTGYTLDFHINTQKPNNQNDIIKQLVYEMRSDYDNHWGYGTCETNTMSGACSDMTDILQIICAERRIKCIPFEFYSGVTNHYAAIVVLPNREEYVVDCTYQQFFLLADNLPNRFIFLNGEACQAYVGNAIIQMQQESFARNLIESGYFKVDNQSLKIYLNSLVLAFSKQHEKDKCLTYSGEKYRKEIKKNKCLGCGKD